MGRLILRYQGAGSPAESDLARISAVPKTKVIDQTSRMVFVDGDEDALRAALGGREWLVTPERAIERPDPRPAVKHKP